MKELIDKSDITAEIKKLRSNLIYGACSSQIAMETRCKEEAYNEVLSFIDTLEVKEVDEDTISKDLEYAALLYYPKMSRISEPHGFIPADNKSHYLGDANEDNRKAFIVGAQWQKEKMVDKACEWLKLYRQDTPDGIGYIAGIVNDKTIEEFRKAMEE